MTTVLFAFGYPVSIGVIVRWLPVVRERRIKWFAAHFVAVCAIVTGWALKGDTQAVVVNGSWLAVSTVWYALGGPSSRAKRSARRRFSSTA
jgi:hypothetical protein